MLKAEGWEAGREAEVRSVTCDALVYLPGKNDGKRSHESLA